MRLLVGNEFWAVHEPNISPNGAPIGAGLVVVAIASQHVVVFDNHGYAPCDHLLTQQLRDTAVKKLPLIGEWPTVRWVYFHRLAIIEFQPTLNFAMRVIEWQSDGSCRLHNALSDQQCSSIQDALRATEARYVSPAVMLRAFKEFKDAERNARG